MPYDQLNLDRQLCFPLYASARVISRLYRPFLDPLGLTYTQYVTMMALWEKDDVPVGGLGERLFLDSGTLTPLLRNLERQGFVERVRSREDEREVRVRLTGSGRALEEKAAGIPGRMATCIGLSLQDAGELHRILHGFLDREKRRPAPGDSPEDPSA